MMPSQSKLDAHAVEGRQLGFDQKLNDHHIYWSHKHKVIVERNITFSKRELQLIKGEQEDFDIEPIDDNDLNLTSQK